MPLPKGYSWTPKSMQVQPPPTREDIQLEKDNFQIDKEWKWDNEQNVGPQGEQPPTNAVGWQPNGQAYYGEGLSGWWGKVTGKITDAFNYGHDEGLRISDLSKSATALKNYSAQQLTGASTYETKKKTEGDIEKKEEDTKAFSEKVGETETGAVLLGVAEAAKETLNQAVWTVLDGLGAVSVKAEQVLGTAGYTVADIASGQGVSGKQFEKNWNAARMAYSTVFDASIYDEMTRRTESGMNVEFAAQEVMSEKKWTMWSETIGQAILDPLNAVSVLTKAGDALLLRRTVQSQFHKIINPAVRKVLQNAGKMDEAGALRYTNDVIREQQAMSAVYSHIDEIAKADRTLVKGSQSYKMGNLTSTGKMSRLANHTSEIMMHVANNSDDATEIIMGMIKSTSANKAEAAEGLAAMMNFVDSPALFSQAGNDTVALLSRIYNKHGAKWLDKIDTLKGDKQAFIKEMFSVLDEAGSDLYPSVSKMLEAEDLVKVGGKIDATGAKIISEDMKKLAEAAKNLPEHVKVATRAHDKAQQFIQPINKGFAALYMGWSPGFAFRNLSNNTMQVAVDQGWKSILGASVDGKIFTSADNMIIKAEKFHGGDIAGQFGIGSKGVIEETAKTASKTDAISAVKKVVKESKLVGKNATGPGQILGEVAEINSAKRVLATAYMREYRVGTKAMFKAITPELKAAGVSDDIIKKLPSLMEKHGGNLDEIMTSLRSSVDSGVMDMFDDVSRVDPEYQKALQGLNVWDDYVDKVLGAATREEAVAAADEMFGTLAKQADMVYADGRMITTEYDKFARALEAGGKEANSAARGMVIEARMAENNRAIEAAFQIIEDAEAMEAKMKLGYSVKPKGFFNKTVGNWGEDAAKVRDALLDRVVKGKDDLKKLRTQADYQKFWNDYPELLQGPIPENITFDELTDRFWSSYFDQSAGIWGGARDDAIRHVTTYLDNLTQSGAKVPDEWRTAIKEATERAQDYDNALVGEGGKIMRNQERLPYGTRSSQIAEIANKYGVSTSTEKFVPTDKATLRVINKYAGVTYRSLEEVPLEVAEKAFASKTKAVTATTPKIPISKATDVPRSELPAEVSTRFADEAKRLLNELTGGEPGKRTAMGATGTTNVSWYRELYKKGLQKPEIDKALNKIIMDQGADKGVNVERMKDMILDNFKLGDSASGTPPDLNALKLLGADKKTLQEALDAFNDITKQDATLEEAIRLSGGGDEVLEATQIQDLTKPYYDEAGKFIDPSAEKYIMPHPDDTDLSTARAIHDQMDKIGEMGKWIKDDIAKNFGRKQVIDKVGEKALRTVEGQLKTKLAEVRLYSSRAAQEARKFTLLDYGEKTYMDVAKAYLFPYHFWYKGTYRNWIHRVVTNPDTLAHYDRYKQNLANIHAGMPEWWKNNINTNEIFGIDSDNPLYLNIEATLWPLNGITGADFNDPDRRVNWWTTSLDYVNKFGPSLWTPISMITGASLLAKGETEAGQKWMGRVIPQTATIKAGASMLGIANLELDPIVKFIDGGLDPYEERRVQRALATMEQDALAGKLPYTQEQIQDAAYNKSGEIWDTAVQQAIRGRAPSQLSSFFLGVGFKGRTQQDMEIDKFYSDYSRLWALSAGKNLTPEEFKQGMSQLKDKYPFMDTALLARRDSDERDAGLAYLVMQRIPPGASSDFATAAGIDPALLEKFYEDRGQIDEWAASDRQKFMGGILTMSAVLEIPSDMTRKEWEKAKTAYSSMNTQAKDQFGENILDLVDGYYQWKQDNPDGANDYLDNHPEVSQYMDWKAERIMGSPLLSSYYGGASMIEGYYRGKMYSDIETKMGAQVFDIMDEYNDLKTYGEPSESKKFYNQNKATIKQYYALKDKWNITINQKTAELSSQIPEGEAVQIREDYDATSPTQSQFAEGVQPQQQVNLQAVLSPRLQNLLVDYLQSGESLPESARSQLSRLANEYGFGSVDDMIQQYGQEIYQQ